MYYYNIKCIKRVYAAFCTLLFHSEGSVHEGRKRHIRNLQLIKLKIQTEGGGFDMCKAIKEMLRDREDKKVRMKWRSNREAYVIKSHQRIIKSHHG